VTRAGVSLRWAVSGLHSRRTGAISAIRAASGPCHRRRIGRMAWWASQRSAPQGEREVNLVHIGNPGLGELSWWASAVSSPHL